MKTIAKQHRVQGGILVALLGTTLVGGVAQACMLPQLVGGPGVTDIALQKNTGSILSGTEWELVNPTYPGLKKRPVLRFSDKRLSASVGLNSMSGDYAVSGKTLTVKPMISTKMAGPQPLMEAERKYAEALQSVKSFKLSEDGTKLTLKGKKTLTFLFAGRTTTSSQER